MTVRQLFDYIHKHGVNLDAEILYQRIEDSYFEGSDVSGLSGTMEDGTLGVLPPGSKASPWKVVRKEGEAYMNAWRFNQDIDGKYLDKRRFPKFDRSKYLPYSEEELEQLKAQYIDIHCAVRYHDDDNLYLDAHY